LYAAYASKEVWAELGLGNPPDDRPLYVGKAEDSVVSRDVTTHFGDGRTGSSTLRRSLAALLRQRLGLSGVPRNPQNPGYYANYGLSAVNDRKLTDWMRTRILLASWPAPKGADLRPIENTVIGALRPPLNLQNATTPWTALVRRARKVMADEASEYAARSADGGETGPEGNAGGG